MADVAQLTLIVNSSGVANAANALNRFTGSAGGAEIAVGRLASQLFGLYSAYQSVTAAVSNALTESRITQGLTTMTNSAQQAGQMIQQLNNYSNSSQFALPGLEEDARLLTAMGFSAKEVVPDLVAIGNALQNTGASADSMNSVVNSLVRMKDEGQLSVFTLRNMEREGVPAGKILADALNESVVQVMQQVRNQTIDANSAMEVLIQGIGRWGQNMKVSADNAYVLVNVLRNNLVNTLKDVVAQMILTFDRKVGIKNTINDIQGVGEVLRDIINVMGGGIPKYEQTKTLVTEVAAAFRILAAVLEILVAIKIAQFVMSIAANLEIIAPLLLILIAIDIGAWAAKQFPELKKLVDLLERLANLGGFRDKSIHGLATFFTQLNNPGMSVPDDKNVHMLGPATPSELKSGKLAGGEPQIFGPDGKPIPAGGFKPEDPVTQIGNIFGNGLGDINSKIQAFLGSSLDGFSSTLAKISKQVKDQIGDIGNDAKVKFQIPPQVQQTYDNLIEKLKEEKALVGQTAATRQGELEILKVKQQLIDRNIPTDSGQGKEYLDKITDAVHQLEMVKNIDTLAQGMGNAFANAFSSIISGAKSSTAAFREMGKAIEDMVIKQLFTDNISGLLSQGIGGVASLFMGGGSSAGTTSFSNSSFESNGFGVNNTGPLTGPAYVPSADGNAFDNGIMAFARGGVFKHMSHAASMSHFTAHSSTARIHKPRHGRTNWPFSFADGAGFSGGDVVSTPTFFGMQGGMGMMGEAGPEAIMPLARGSDGKLGVRTQGNSGPQQQVNNYHFHGVTDADSFRRSQRQISAQMQKMMKG